MTDQDESRPLCIEVMTRQTHYTTGDSYRYYDPQQMESHLVIVWFEPSAPRVPKGYRRGTVYAIEVFASYAYAKRSVKKLFAMSETKLFALLLRCWPNVRPLKQVK